MGIDGQIRKYLHAHAATKAAWVGKNGFTRPNKPSVEIVDILTEMHVMKNPARQWTQFFTGEEFYRVIRRWIETASRNKNVAAYVICMDYQPHVPHRKHAEQKRRAHARSASSSSTSTNADAKQQLPPRGDYRSGSAFVDAGIMEPQPVITEVVPSRSEPAVSASEVAQTLASMADVDMQDVAEDKDQDRVEEEEDAERTRVVYRMREPEPFDLRVVLGQRRLRSALIAYVADRMLRDTPIPGVLVLFDYNNKVQLLRHEPDQPTDQWTLRDVLSRCFEHRYGESDKKMLFWLRVFHNYVCRLRSVDGDMLPLILQYLTTTQPAREEPVYWIYSSWRRGKNSTGGLIDMNQLMTCMHSKLKWETQELMLACILCGTDYFQKADLFHQVGYLYILYAVQQSRAQVQVLWDYSTAHAFDDTHVDMDLAADTKDDDRKQHKAAVDAFEVIVRRIYNLRILHRNLVTLQSDFDALGADDRKQEQMPPTLAQLREIVEEKWTKMCVPTRQQIQAQTHLVAWHIHYWCLQELDHKVPRLDFLDVMVTEAFMPPSSGAGLLTGFDVQA